MIEVSLVMYELIGKTSMHSRKEIVLTLQDGKDIRYLKIEDRENTYYKLYTPIDGRLDSIDEIPRQLKWMIPSTIWKNNITDVLL